MDLEKIQEHREQQRLQKEDKLKQQELSETINKASGRVERQIAIQSDKTRRNTQRVEVTNQPEVRVDHTIDFKPLLASLKAVKSAIDSIPTVDIPETKEVSVNNLRDYTKQIDSLISTVKGIELKPQVNVSTPEVVVPAQEIDLKPIITKLDKVIDGIKKIKPATIPKTDFKPLQTAVKSVQTSIEGLRFPVPNYILPFSSGGKATQVALDSGGNVPVSGSLSASITGDAVPVSGASEAISVQVVDGSGDQIASFGGGTQYTEADTDTTITGTAVMWEDSADTLRAVSAAKPLPVSVTGGGDATAANQTTMIGHVDGIEGLLTTIDADTSAVAGAVSGTEMQVDIVSGAQTDALTDTELRASPVTVDLGANNDVTVTGTVTANLSATDNAVLDAIAAAQLPDGHNVTVDNASIAVTGGGGTQYSTNSIYADGNTGTLALTIRDDALTTLAEADGDYSALRVDSTGRQWVTHTALDNLDGGLVELTAFQGGAWSVSGTVTANLSATDNAVLDTIDAVLDTIKVDTEAIETAVEGTLTVDSEKVASANTSGKVSVGNTSTSVLASNGSRKSFAVVNDSDEEIYLNLSGTAVMNEGVRLNASGGNFSTDQYTGAVTAICSSGTKNLTVTEL